MIGVMARRVTSPVFIGRDRELALLAEAADRATNGQASTVLIGGEAGVGKTRLVAEFAERARATGAIVLQGACVSVGGDEGLPFGPIAQALRGLVRDQDSAALESLLDGTTSELATLVPGLGVASEGSGSGRPEWAQARVFEGLLTLLGRLGDRAPTVLIAEDLHWADRSTRDLLAFLARNLESARVLVIATFRSDELNRRHPLRPWLAEMDRSPRVGRTEVGRLSPSDVRVQLAAILGSEPEIDLVESIVRRGDGNPFFTEELLAAGDGESGGQVPASLRDVLLVRVNAISDRAHGMLACAAVAGTTFDPDLLLQACDCTEADVSAGLREALNAQLIVSPGADGPLSFRHALLQEAVYSDVLPRDRRRWHSRYAEALSERPVPDGADGASQLALLAYHATAAHDLPLALRGWIDAARASADVYALAEASDAFERALDMWDAVDPDARPPDVDIVGLMYEASLALIGCGQLTRARDVAAEAVRRFDSAGDPIRAALLRERYARALWLTSDLTASVRVLEEAVELCRYQPSTADSAWVTASLAGALMLQDQMTRAIVVGREAIRLARKTAAPHVEAYAMCGLGVAYVDRGDCKRGLALLVRAAEMAKELQLSAIDFHRTHANLSTAYQMCGELERSLAVALDGVEWAKRRALWRLQGAFLEANAASALIELGRWDEARTLLDQRERPIVEGVALLNHALVAGVLAVRTGRLDEARALLTPARHAIARLGDAQFTGPIYAGLVELAIAEGRLADAVELADEAIDRMRDAECLGVRYRVELHALALHAANLATTARPRRGGDGTLRRDDAERRIEAVRAAVAASVGPPDGTGGETLGLAAFAEAEFLASQGAPDPEAWAAATAIWRRLGRPWSVARGRAAESRAILAVRRSRVDAAPPLREAYRIALGLGARPLADDCATLARMARLDLDEGNATEPETAAGGGDGVRPIEPPAETFGLTARELEVLRLLADGYSNRRIAEALFVTESTAGVHVSNILGKLGVTSRLEAATVAVRTGIAD